MFDIGFWELVLIGVIALLVVGPERLPAMARNVGLWVGRIRRYVAHVKDDIEREIRAEELRELMKESSSIDSLDQDLKEAGDSLKEFQNDIEKADASMSDNRVAHEESAGSEVDAAGSALGERIARKSSAGDENATSGSDAPESGSEKHERRSEN